MAIRGGTNLVALDDSRRAALCALIRNKKPNTSLADIESDRLAIYKELFFNNIKNFLDNFFPILACFYSKENWTQLASAFMSDHCSQTPYFREINREFLLYLQYEYQTTAQDPPFMLALAHYEWVTTIMEYAAQTFVTKDLENKADLLQQVVAVSPLVCSLRYDYAVHTIKSASDPSFVAQKETFVIVYRDRSDTVGVMESNIVTARLLELFAASSLTAKQALAIIADELGRQDIQQVLEHGAKTVKVLQEADIIMLAN